VAIQLAYFGVVIKLRIVNIHDTHKLTVMLSNMIYFVIQVEFSPFFENRLACASAANFGIVGNGRLWILNVDQAGIVTERM
jgi:hypothetical protein